MRPYHHIILVGAFCAFLFGSLLGSVFHWDLYATQGENRRLAVFPDFTALPVEKWPQAFETYFNDHFGFRNTLIRRYVRMMRKIGRDDKVIYGSDGWLYFNDDAIIKDFLGYRMPDAGELQRRFERMVSRRTRLKRENIEYLVVIAPNKATIYPEYLPVQIVQSKGKTNRECLLEYISGRFDENLLDLAPLLRRAKPGGVLYSKTDTHWNARGAYIAYAHIVEGLHRLLPDLPAVIGLSALEASTSEYTGDLARMTGVPDKHLLHEETLANPEASTWTITMLDHPALAGREHQGNPPYTVHNPQGRYNAVVFHDSFMAGMKDLLPHHFKNTTFVWAPSNSNLLDMIIGQCQPKIVIEEVVERVLVKQDDGAFPDEVGTDRNSNGL